MALIVRVLHLFTKMIRRLFLKEEFKWLRLDELENALDNLEMVSFFLKNIDDERKWKWAIIAMHQALYGFAICATTPTDSSLALRNPKDHESRLISIWTALERAKSEEWKKWGISAPLETSSEEDIAIDKLVKEFRNEFEHFRPKAWSIEITGMPEIIKHVLRVVRHLALDSNSVTYYDEGSEKRTKGAINSIESCLTESASA
jgi:hypothetical protein